MIASAEENLFGECEARLPALLSWLSEVEDFRIARTRKYRLAEILLTAVLATLCGARSYRAFQAFGESHAGLLREFVPMPNGIPSHDTFARVFRLLDSESFNRAFRRWTSGRATPGGVLAMDGKALRGAATGGGTAPRIVSAWDKATGTVLAQMRVPDKTNEIPAVRELLRQMRVAECVVTLDALSCQKATVRAIRARGADYMISLKGNQSGMLEELKSFMEEEIASKRLAPGAQSIEKGHGRIETRTLWQTEDLDWFEDRGEWDGLASACLVESRRIVKDAHTRETRLYVSSLKGNPKRAMEVVRQHWGIENGLHWRVDTQFAEDACRARCGNAPENLAILRHVIVNIFARDEDTSEMGLHEKAVRNCGDPERLKRLIGAA